jgi:hypothetical protein
MLAKFILEIPLWIKQSVHSHSKFPSTKTLQQLILSSEMPKFLNTHISYTGITLVSIHELVVKATDLIVVKAQQLVKALYGIAGLIPARGPMVIFFAAVPG